VKSIIVGLVVFLVMGGATVVPVSAQEFANVEYLCCDWGPAMTTWGKTNEPPQFNETEEEVYFLKQVGSFTRGKATTPNPVSGGRTREIGHGISVYLCKMKPDGSGKTELKELWRNPNYPIDTQGQSTWMDVKRKTHKIAMSITYAGNSITGLWTMNLDGSELKRIITPEQNEKHLQAINHPSWTPDGQWIVFEEELRGTRPNQHRIAKCDRDGKNFSRLTEGPWDEQPAVSPDGGTIIFGHVGDAKTGGNYLMNIDGTNRRIFVNPNDKRKGHHSGAYPAWSPDGMKIFAPSMGIVDAITGQKLLDRRPIFQGRQGTCGWSHWGKLGFIGFTISGIRFTPPELMESEKLGSSHLIECSSSTETSKW